MYSMYCTYERARGTELARGVSRKVMAASHNTIDQKASCTQRPTSAACIAPATYAYLSYNREALRDGRVRVLPTIPTVP